MSSQVPKEPLRLSRARTRERKREKEREAFSLVSRSIALKRALSLSSYATATSRVRSQAGEWLLAEQDLSQLLEPASTHSIDLEFRWCFESGRDESRGSVTTESVLESQRFVLHRWNDRSFKSGWKRPSDKSITKRSSILWVGRRLEQEPPAPPTRAGHDLSLLSRQSVSTLSDDRSTRTATAPRTPPASQLTQARDLGFYTLTV